MAAKKINVDKLMEKLKGISIEQKEEVYAKTGELIKEGRSDYIKKLRAKLEALESGAPLPAEEEQPTAAAADNGQSAGAPTTKKGKGGMKAVAQQEEQVGDL